MFTRGSFLSSLGASVAAIDVPSYTSTTVIGVALPLSGDARRAGEGVLSGVRQAIDDANQTRLGLARAFTLTTYDDHNGPADAVVQAGFVSNDANVVAVIGHLSASATISALRTYVTSGMPLIVPTSTDDRITETRFGNVFRLPARDSVEGQILARAIIRDKKPAKPLVLVQDGDYGADVATGIITGFRAGGVTASYVQYAWQKPDVAKIVQQVMSQAPDQVTLAGTAVDMGSTLAALRAAGYAGPMAASQGFFDALTVTKYAQAAEGMIISSSMPYLPLAPQSVRIQRDYETRYGAAFSLLPAFGYAAAQVVMAATNRAGVANRVGLLRALQVAQSFDTVLGPITFGGDGDVLDPNLYLYSIAAGTFKYLRQAKPGGYLLR